MKHSGTFITFSFACFAASLWSKICVPETANVSLEEVDKLFKSEASREDTLLKEEVRHFESKQFIHNRKVAKLKVPLAQIMREIGLDTLIQELSSNNNSEP